MLQEVRLWVLKSRENPRKMQDLTKDHLGHVPLDVENIYFSSQDVSCPGENLGERYERTGVRMR